MCRALIKDCQPPAEDGCQRLFEQVLAREYSDPAYGEAHLLTVDCYSLQHPEVHRPSSNAFHLLRLGWTLNRVRIPKLGRTDNDFKRYAYDLRDFPCLEAPADRGRITVADIKETDPEEHMKAVCVWAGSVWKAYSMHHYWVKEKLEIGF
jgi:hypothetical protein